jgi:hypothetical protein
MQNQDIENIMDRIEALNSSIKETIEFLKVDASNPIQMEVQIKSSLTNLEKQRELVDEIYTIIQYKYYLKTEINQAERLPDVGSYYKRLDCMGKWKCVDLQIERTPDGNRIAVMSLDGQVNVERFDLKKGFWNHFKEYSV